MNAESVIVFGTPASKAALGVSSFVSRPRADFSRFASMIFASCTLKILAIQSSATSAPFCWWSIPT